MVGGKTGYEFNSCANKN